MGTGLEETAGRFCRASALLPLVLAVAGIAGCAQPPPGREVIADDLLGRSGHTFSGGVSRGDFSSIETEAVLTESQAIDLALRNNAEFQERLATLGFSRADLIQAGLIDNPDASLLIPIGPKQLEATVVAPLESLWLRGLRVDAAQLAFDRHAAVLCQAGLDLIRDVRLAYANLALARRRHALFEESSRVRQQVLRIAQRRVDAGDALPLDVATARIDAERAELDAKSLRHDVAIAEERLRALLGAGGIRTPLELQALASPDAASPDVEALVAQGLHGRPDMRVASLSLAAAHKQADLARIDWFSVAFIADANDRGDKGFEAGPGIRFTLPIFNRNQGSIARADAEVERAWAQQQVVRDRIILEVREAHARLLQAREDLTAWRERIVPGLDQTVALAERSYENGETSLLQVLETSRQLLDARAHEAQAAANLRRAWAELERSIGQRIDRVAATSGPITMPATRESPSAMPPSTFPSSPNSTKSVP